MIKSSKLKLIVFVDAFLILKIEIDEKKKEI